MQDWKEEFWNRADVAHTLKLIPSSQRELLIAEMSDNIQILLNQQKREIVEELVNKFQMEGEYGKLTPFQETVNTYIKNRGEEVLTTLNNL